MNKYNESNITIIKIKRKRFTNGDKFSNLIVINETTLKLNRIFDISTNLKFLTKISNSWIIFNNISIKINKKWTDFIFVKLI